MNIDLIVCMFLLMVDAVAWAYQRGFWGALPWLAAMAAVYVLKKWQDRANARVPSSWEVRQARARRRARMA